MKKVRELLKVRTARRTMLLAVISVAAVVVWTSMASGEEPVDAPEPIADPVAQPAAVEEAIAVEDEALVEEQPAEEEGSVALSGVGFPELRLADLVTAPTSPDQSMGDMPMGEHDMADMGC